MKGFARTAGRLGALFGLALFIAGWVFQARHGHRPDAGEIRDLIYLLGFESVVVSLGLSRVVGGLAESVARRGRSPQEQTESFSQESTA